MRLLPWELFPELGYVTVRMLMWAQVSQAKWLLGGPLGALVILILLQSAPKGPWSWGSQAEHIAGVFESIWLWSVAQVRFVFNENCPVGSERDAEGMDGFFWKWTGCQGRALLRCQQLQRGHPDSCFRDARLLPTCLVPKVISHLFKFSAAFDAQPDKYMTKFFGFFL